MCFVVQIKLLSSGLIILFTGKGVSVLLFTYLAFVHWTSQISVYPKVQNCSVYAT